MTYLSARSRRTVYAKSKKQVREEEFYAPVQEQLKIPRTGRGGSKVTGGRWCTNVKPRTNKKVEPVKIKINLRAVVFACMSF